MAAAAANGVAVLLVEQQVRTALIDSDRAYVLRRGEVVLEGPSHDLLDRIDEIDTTYLAAGAE